MKSMEVIEISSDSKSGCSIGVRVREGWKMNHLSKSSRAQ